jgi:glycolate oxidase
MSIVESRVSHDALAQAFSGALAGPDAVLTDADALAAHSHDYWGLGNAPWMVVKPRSTDEVVAIVRIAAEHDVPLVTRGGASNCAGAVMADDERVMIDLSGMNQLISVTQRPAPPGFSQAS